MTLTRSATPRLDRKFVASATSPANKPEITYWDASSPGLGLRVLRSGAKSWIVRYRVGRRQRFTTIGRADDLRPEQAREVAATFRAKAKLGHDPGAEVETLKASVSDTLGKLVNDYMARHVERRQKPRTQAETRRHLMGYWRPLHKAPIPSIDRRRISQELQRIARSHGEVAANRGRSSMSALFTWAIKEGLVETNPVIGTNKVADERTRERVLTDHELAAIWAATDSAGAYAKIVRLLMLTGLRRDEVGALGWSEVDRVAEQIVIGGARTKNGRPHSISITPLIRGALDLDDVKTRSSALVFSGSNSGFSGWSRSKVRLDDRIARIRRDAAAPDLAGKPLTRAERERFGLAQWTLHDIRRTVATRLADQGCEPHVIEEILGHTSGHKAGVHGIYNRSSYEPQKLAALTLWGERLVEIAGWRSASVVLLRAAR